MDDNPTPTQRRQVDPQTWAGLASGPALPQALFVLRELLLGNPAPARLRHTLLPHLVVMAPLIATSLLAPPWMAWLLAWPSLIALYRLTQELDATVFAVSERRGLFGYAAPLNLLMVLWCLALGLSGRGPLLMGTAVAHTALLALAIAPALRRSRRRLTRLVPLHWSFPAVAATTMLVQAASLPPSWFAWLSWLSACAPAMSEALA